MPFHGIQDPTFGWTNKINCYLIFTSTIACLGGLIFGYELGISGGITSRQLTEKFFLPENGKAHARENVYCGFDDRNLMPYISILYAVAMMAPLIAPSMKTALGRKGPMVMGGLLIFVGTLFSELAVNLKLTVLLLLGRVELGFGVGFLIQSVPVYLTEMAPTGFRGAHNVAFQMSVTIGVLLATFVNYLASNLAGDKAWRVSLGLPAIPAAVLVACGTFFLPDTPISLLQQGHPEEARRVLTRIRHEDDVETEYADLVFAASRPAENPWRALLLLEHRPQLIMCIFVPLFQQFGGANASVFLATVVCRIMGYGNSAVLISGATCGLISLMGTAISFVSVDRTGRRLLLIRGGILMVIFQLAIEYAVGIWAGVSGAGPIKPVIMDLLLVLIWCHTAVFAWSWGPLAWLVPSELCPAEIRSQGQGISASVSMASTLVAAQLFPFMLCGMKYGLFLFNAYLMVLVTIFVCFFLPETMHVPLAYVEFVLRDHWVWRHCYDTAADGRA